MTNLTEYLQFPPVLRWETDTRALGGAAGQYADAGQQQYCCIAIAYY